MQNPAAEKYESSFDIDVVGEDSGEPFRGVFRTRTRLNSRQRLTIDQIRRALLGPQPDGVLPLPEASSTAEVLANLRVRLIQAPDWWNNSDGGLELCDGNVAAEIYTKAIKAQLDARAAILATGEAARKSLTDGAIKAPA